MVPLVMATWLAKQGVEREARIHLQSTAQWAIRRAQLSFEGARQALDAMQQSTEPACSTAHIAHMQSLTANTRFIEEIGYFEGGLLRCNSWGTVATPVHQGAADYLLDDGTEVFTAIRPQVGNGTAMVGLQRGNYNVLIIPSRLADVLTDSPMQIGLVANNGALLAYNDGADRARLATLVQGAQPPAGMWVEQAQAPGWRAIVVSPQTSFSSLLNAQWLWLLPLAIVCAAALVGLVAWLCYRRLSPLGELQIAVSRGEFEVHYQPIMHLAGGQCVGAEALVRWRRPDGSLVRPDLFIPLAEESGLIQPITDQVLALIVKDLGPLLRRHPQLHIAVNLCAEDLKSGRALPVIKRVLEGSGIDPAQLWLEATERGFMDIERARQTIEAAREAGHRVAIDDFGTGYSSLQYLQGLPLDVLKIDKAFIDTIGADAATSAVTGYIIDMAHELGLGIVAEGVETLAQAEYLKARQVDYVQGWLYARALPLEQFLAFFEEHRAPAEGAGA
ncbi:sensor c-di-GMP phosphodiesterase, contains CSS-motif sensor and EAL domain [Pseudomonas sp. URIL14HWK12:I9]|nr:sensor c-di-GMP phosphodiesterase-like protein [Pseudomonas sp. URIL14HWK12:I12]PVZ26924.1 sensor c-di-GMP phosphodiesterase-like protein [Pseudomonas sp. URIL14HWK12:I10]PVZ37813.1 sensor c-di-GMP phosphodiesterase-like protein [Pseudomonas sp. URIL14HWK12:I11]SNZ05566.1 sensor c-di-GMP phosphodiesterase, contains CSS-motif sensor and EAL domain [Pseudomonas sp. URIL14HWK12:I9]